MNNTQIIDRRKHPRVRTDWEIQLIGPKETYVSYAMNVSEGGMLIKDPLPLEFRGRVFPIILMARDRGRQIIFKCKVSAPGLSQVRRLLISDAPAELGFLIRKILRGVAPAEQ